MKLKQYKCIAQIGDFYFMLSHLGISQWSVEQRQYKWGLSVNNNNNRVKQSGVKNPRFIL